MSQDTVYISATEIGLVKWDEFRKPPYSAQDYLDAYNNGMRMTQAFNDANANGASKAVLERGNYPFCYVNSSSVVASASTPFIVNGTTDFEIDGNGSTVFAIFDSINRSPYHTGMSLEPFQLSGSLFKFTNNTNLKFHKFNLRGDQYNRAWVAGEKDIEQTYGILLSENNYNTKIDVVGHGFRGDAISGNYKGDMFFELSRKTWTKGGLHKNNGTVITELGAYTSPLVDLSGEDIKRNAVQIMTVGNKVVDSRDDSMVAFFYDSNQNYTGCEYVWQAEFIYLPKDCRYVQFVMYGDERETETIELPLYVHLSTGCSDIAEVRGEYYANHRGAVSNLCNNTTITADIHDNGTTKQGFPIYFSTTRYGVNFEDVYVSSLHIKDSIIKNTGSAVLCNARTLRVENSTIENCAYAAFGLFSTKNSFINNNKVINCGGIFECSERPSSFFYRNHIFSNNIVTEGNLTGNYTDSKKLLITIKDNIFNKCSVSLIGGDSVITVTDNVFSDLVQKGTSYEICILVNLSVLSNNFFSLLNGNRLPTGVFAARLGAKVSYGNRLLNNIKRSSSIDISNVSDSLNSGIILETDENYTIDNWVRFKERTQAGDSTVSKRYIKDLTSKGYLSIGVVGGGANILPNTIVFEDCNFDATVGLLSIYLRTNLEPTNHRIIIKNCKIDITNTTRLIKSTYAMQNNTVSIEFVNCDFYSDTQQASNLKVFAAAPASGFTVTAKNCSFTNVNVFIPK